MKSCAWAVPVFFVFRFVPFFNGFGTIGFIALLVVIPVWALRWWLRFAGIAAQDADFLRARNIVKIYRNCLLASLGVLGRFFHYFLGC